MKKEIIIAGFGGQGVLSMGKILAYSGLMEDKEVTWMPAYGPEQRGGTANVTVIVSDERISSPILSKYDIAIVLNQPSLEKFGPRVVSGGTIFINSSFIKDEVARDDVKVISVPCDDIANGLIYSADGKDVCLTMCDGMTLYRDGEYTFIDIEKTIAEAENAKAEILKRL